MKKNTGCSCNSHKCPPGLPSDTAKTHDHFCRLNPLLNVNDFERTVILADVPLTINVEADIKLPAFANDIKAIRKNVYLTQCEAIPVPSTDPELTAQLNLFIEGYVHKNIQFSDGSGILRDHSVNVPFKCFQPITSQLFHFPFCTSQKTNILEIRELAKDGMGGDRCRFGSVTFENFNEPIHCKLLRAQVTQMDFPKNFDTWGRFNKLTEKVTVDLVVRLTQKQRRNDAGTVLDPECFLTAD